MFNTIENQPYRMIGISSETWGLLQKVVRQFGLQQLFDGKTGIYKPTEIVCDGPLVMFNFKFFTIFVFQLWIGLAVTAHNIFGESPPKITAQLFDLARR